MDLRGLLAILGVLIFGHICGKSYGDEDNSEPDHYDKAYPLSLNASRQSFDTIVISWCMPEGNETSSQDLNNFIIYHHKRSQKGQLTDYEVSVVASNQSSYIMEGLEPGTMYSFYVVANYTTGHKPASHTFSYKTLGYGPDNSCDCHVVNSYNSSCNRKTGQCPCRGKNEWYQDRRCDACAPKFYLHNSLGCQPCPDCNLDHSNGSCVVSKEKGNQVLCVCKGPWGGDKCNHCSTGFYKAEDGMCASCMCNSNSEVCDYVTGVCQDCRYNTTGERCQACLPGYIGDAVFHHNCTKYEDVYSSEIETRGSRSNVVVAVSVTALLVALLLLFLAACRRWRSRKPKFNFWTVELKDDHEEVNFSQMMEQPDYRDEALQYHDRAAVPATTPTHERPPLYRPHRPRTQGPYQTLEDRHRDLC